MLERRCYRQLRHPVSIRLGVYRASCRGVRAGPLSLARYMCVLSAVGVAVRSLSGPANHGQAARIKEEGGIYEKPYIHRMM
jgi:hypothetical protein